MKTTGYSLNLIVLLVAIMLPAIPAKAQLKLINLGALGGDPTSAATAINDQGEIVGESTGADGVPHAFYYRNGLLRSLDSKPSRAVAINEAGQIAGSRLTYSTVIFTNIILPPTPITNIFPHPITNISIYPINPIIFTNVPIQIPTNIIVANPLTNILIEPASLTVNAERVAFPTNGQIVTNLVIDSQPVLFRPGLPANLFEGVNNAGYASGINNQGEIVGGVTLFNSITQNAFVYKNGLTMDLPGLSGDYLPAAAMAINNHGDIVGFGGVSPEHPFFYRHGLMQDLGTLGGTMGEANAINDLGEIVGSSTTTSNAEMHAFLYRQGRMIDLGGLPDAQYSTSTNPNAFYPPKLISSASAINNWGQIVGSATAANGASHAFLYHDGMMIDLNKWVRPAHVNGPPGFLTLTAANGINDCGQIVGAGTYWDGRHEVVRAFLMNLPRELLSGMGHLPPP